MRREKSEVAARSEKMTSERDRLTKERTSAEKQLRETELKLKEMMDKVVFYKPHLYYSTDYLAHYFRCQHPSKKEQH